MNDHRSTEGGDQDSSSDPAASGFRKSGETVGDGGEMTKATAELVSRLLAGELSDAEQALLEEQLRADEALRTAYLQQAVVHGMLHWSRGKGRANCIDGIDPIIVAEMLLEAESAARQQVELEAAEKARMADRAMAEQRRIEAELERSRNRRPPPIEIPSSVLYFGAVALAACLFWVASFVFSPKSAPTVVNETPPPTTDVPDSVARPLIATLTNSVEADLTAVADKVSNAAAIVVSVHSGAELTAGEYHLHRGVIELEMESGVRTLIEGPAEFTLVSEDRVRVERGRLVGDVPAGSIGFTVETRSAAIVDLGTEFGVSVSQDQTVGVAVFGGEVEVVATAGNGVDRQAGELKRQRLTPDQSVQIDREGALIAAEVNPNHFFRRVPSKAELAKKEAYERWLAYCNDLEADPDLVAHYTFDNQKPADLLLFNRAGDGQSFHGKIVGAQWVDGRWPQKQALQFAKDDTDESWPHVNVEIPGQSDGVTLAAWVMFDDIRNALNGLLLSKKRGRLGQLHWQLLANARMHAGVVHDTGDGDFDSDGGVPINLGQWHLLTIVLNQRSGQVQFFIDGKLDGTKNGSLASGLPLGQMVLGGWEPDSDLRESDYAPLHGKIDEVLVFRRALSGDEIDQLYRVGMP